LCSVTGFSSEQFQRFVEIIAVAVHRNAPRFRSLHILTRSLVEPVAGRIAVKALAAGDDFQVCKSLDIVLVESIQYRIIGIKELVVLRARQGLLVHHVLNVRTLDVRPFAATAGRQLEVRCIEEEIVVVEVRHAFCFNLRIRSGEEVRTRNSGVVVADEQVVMHVGIDAGTILETVTHVLHVLVAAPGESNRVMVEIDM